MARKSVRAERRTQILEGLFAAMAREGVRDASVTEVAEAAGIARGALHYYFDSKDEIREALMRRLGDGYLEGLREALERAELRSPDDPRAPLRALVRFHFSGDTERSERLLGVWIDFWGQASTDARLNAVVRDVQERARQLCGRCIQRAQPSWATASGASRRHASAGLLALVEGALLQWRVALQGPHPLERDALAAQVLQASSAYLDRIALEPETSLEPEMSAG